MKAKNIAALPLAAAMVLLCGTGTAFAVDDKTLAEEAENLADLYLRSGTPKAQAVGPITQAALLEKIPQYVYEDGVLRAVGNSEHYPVSADGEVFGIFITTHDDQLGDGNSFSSEYAEELCDFAAENDRLCVVYDDAGAWFLSPDARELFRYDPGYSDDIFDDPTKDIFRDAAVDLGKVEFWNTKNPEILATLHFDPETWKENWESWEKRDGDEEEEETLVRVDTEVLREDLADIGDYGIFVGSVMRVYQASLREYALTGELSLEPHLFEGGQLYVGDVGDDGAFQGNITFTLDGDAPGIQMFAPGTDESRSIEAQKDKDRLRSLLEQRGIEAEKLSVKMVFVDGLGYVFLADTGEAKALVRSGLKGTDNAYFNEQSGGVLLLDDDLRAKAAAQLEEIARREEQLAALAPGENPDTAGAAVPADAPLSGQENRNTVYLAGGVLILALAAGLVIHRRRKSR